MSEPGWNPTPTPASNSESRPPTESEAAQDMTLSQSPAAQASGGSSFPPVNYGGWGQGQSAGRKKIEDHDSLDQTKDDDDEGPEHDKSNDEVANHHDDHDDEPAASGSSTASRWLASLGSVVQGTGATAKQGVAMARRYPRASMASGLSAAILGAVMILQPGKGKHDTTAQIPAAPAQTPTPYQTQTAKTDPPAPAASSSSTPKADDPTPGSGEKSGALAGTELPVLPGGSDAVAGKGQASSPGNYQGLLAEAKAEPAPDASGNAPAPLPAGEPVKLTSSEGLVALPPVGDPPAAQSEKNGPAHVADLAPAPVLSPVMELAAADVKPGTPPDTAHAPAPLVTPVSAPAVESPAAAAPMPEPVPTPAPPAGPAGKAVAHDGESGVKEASNAKGHAALGTAAAATIVGGAALGAVTALSAGGHDQAKANDKQITSVQPAPATLPAPAPAPASASPAVKTGEPKPLAGTPAPVHVAGPDSNSHPAPLVAPGPIVVEPRSRTEAPSAAAPGELATLHPAGDPGPGSYPVAGVGGRGGDSVKPGGDVESHDRPRSASPAEQAATDNSEELARQGWVPIRHSGGEAVRDVQREVPGLEDNAALGTAAGTTDPNAHADKEQSFDIESPPAGRSGEGANSDAARAGTRLLARGEGRLETVLHRVEGRENFWDISRMYYNSGRYYRALWKANEDKVPEITKLHQGTVVRIPPPEDLDPAYIEPPGKRPGQSRRDGEILARHEGEADDSASTRSDPATTNRRTGNVSGDGVPIRHSSRSDVELNLPVSDAATEQASGRDRSSRGSSRSDPDAEPEIRTRNAVARPIYKVRQYDTLRTIARDTLDDPRRANEILDLNRDIINDPAHLIVGQILELPEDARPGRARNRR